MKKRLLMAVVCIVALPLFLSTSNNVNLTTSTPFGPVAFAGHTLLGAWCECGTTGCLCDPGEQQTGQSAHHVTDKPAERKPKIKPGRVSELDFGTGALMIALAMLVWTRMRS